MDTWFGVLAVFVGFLVWFEALYDLIVSPTEASIGIPSEANFWLLDGGEQRCADDSSDPSAPTDNEDVDFWGSLEFLDFG